MKKSFFFIMAIFLTVFNLFAYSNPVNDIVLEIRCEGGNLPSSESGWLPMRCKTSLEGTLNQYFTIANQADAQQLSNKAREYVMSESYDEDQKEEIDGGNWITPTHTVLLSIRKSSNKYTINVTVTEFSTKREVGSRLLTSDENIQPHDLYSKPGCLINKAAIEICEMFNIQILDKNIILYGEDYYSNEELLNKAIAQITSSKDNINELNYEQSKLKGSKKDADIRRSIEIESKIALEQTALAQAEELKNRAEMSLDLEKSEALKAKSRDAKVNRRINDYNSDMERWERENRNQLSQIEYDYIFSDIDVVEAMKASVLDIKNELNRYIATIEREAKEKIAQAEEELNRPPRVAEQKNGRITEKAKKIRKDKYDSLVRSINSDKLIKVNEYKEIAYSQIQQIRKDIEDYLDNSFNTNKRTMQTLQDSEFIVTFGRYDAPSKAWPLIITIKTQNVIVAKAESLLPYRLVTGKDPYSITEREYEEDVEFYQNIFSTGASRYSFALDYRITPASVNEPSTYNFALSNFRIYDNTKIIFRGNTIDYNRTKPLAQLKFDDGIYKVQFKPIYDIRTTEEIEKYEQDERDKKRRAQIAQQKSKEKQIKKERNRKDSYTKITLTGGLGGSWAEGINTKKGSYWDVRLGGYYGFLPWMYAGTSLTYNSKGGAFSNFYEIGFNMKRSTFGWGQAAIGVFGGFTTYVCRDPNSPSGGTFDPADFNDTGFRSMRTASGGKSTEVLGNTRVIKPAVGVNLSLDTRITDSIWFDILFEFGTTVFNINIGLSYKFFSK